MRREDKKQLTRKLILDVAGKMFAKHGYAETSIDELVREAEIVKGTFYNHFKSKEDLVFALKNDSMESAQAHVEKALHLGVSPLKVLFDLFLDEARWVEKNPEVAKVFLQEVSFKVSSGATIHPPNSKRAPALPLLVSAAQSAGELRRDVDALSLASMFVGLFVHTQLLWLVSKKSGSLTGELEKNFKILLDGIGERESDPKPAISRRKSHR